MDQVSLAVICSSVKTIIINKTKYEKEILDIDFTWPAATKMCATDIFFQKKRRYFSKPPLRHFLTSIT